MIMGILLILRKRENAKPHALTIGSVKMFLSSFAIGITNSAAILTFLFAFSYFGISGQAGIYQGIQLVCGVFIGTYIWWGALSAVVSVGKKKTENRSLHSINRVFGAVLILFGATVFIRAML